MIRTHVAGPAIVVAVVMNLSACGGQSDSDRVQQACESTARHAFKLGDDAPFSDVKLTQIDHSAMRSPFDWLVTGHVDGKEFTGYAQRTTNGQWTCTVERIAG